MNPYPSAQDPNGTPPPAPGAAYFDPITGQQVYLDATTGGVSGGAARAPPPPGPLPPDVRGVPPPAHLPPAVPVPDGQPVPGAARIPAAGALRQPVRRRDALLLRA